MAAKYMYSRSQSQHGINQHIVNTERMKLYLYCVDWNNDIVMTRGAGLHNRRREKREDPALEECCKCLTKNGMSITKPVMYWHSKIKTTYLLWESD